MIGLPGAGKTTAAREISRCITSATLSTVHHVEYDAAAPQATAFDAAEWKASRARCFESVRQIVETCDEGGRTMVIVDDNMHYRSMRLPFFQLARDSGRACFVQLYVDVDRECAWRRNAARPEQQRVSRATFDRLSAALEPPDTSAHAWEAPTLVYTPGGYSGDIAALARSLLAAWGSPPPAHHRTALERQSADRARTAASRLHALDLATRKALSEAIARLRSAPGGGPDGAARGLNDARRAVLSEARALLSQQRAEAGPDAADDEVAALQARFAAACGVSGGVADSTQRPAAGDECTPPESTL